VRKVTRTSTAGFHDPRITGEGRKWAAELLGGRISCIVGILLGAGGILFALLGASANVSAGAVGAALGVLGYKALGTDSFIML